MEKDKEDIFLKDYSEVTKKADKEIKELIEEPASTTFNTVLPQIKQDDYPNIFSNKENADTIVSLSSLNQTHAYPHEELIDKNKLDTNRVMAGVLEDFLPALAEVAKLGSMNNKPFGKYDRGSWMLVENAEQRHLDAWWRHVNAGRHNIDESTGMPHDVAIAWNSLALLWFRLKREGKI